MDALKNRLFTERISTEHRAPSCSRAAEPNPVIDRITVVPRESVQGDFKEQPVLVPRVLQEPERLVLQEPERLVLQEPERLVLQAPAPQVLTQPVRLLQVQVEPSPKWCPDSSQVLASRERKLAQWLPAPQRAALLCCPSATSGQ
jgi:hypothetical protein